MQQDPDQAEKEDDKASTGGMSSLVFNFLSDFENGTDTLEAMTELADEGTSTLEPPSAFMGTETFDGITKEKKDRRHCQSTFLGNVARRSVGGAS